MGEVFKKKSHLLCFAGQELLAAGPTMVSRGHVPDSSVTVVNFAFGLGEAALQERAELAFVKVQLSKKVKFQSGD